MSFSQRYGYKPIRSTVQLNSIDEPLSNGLWTILLKSVFDRWAVGYWEAKSKNSAEFLWVKFYKKPVDEVPEYVFQATQHVRNEYFKSKWFEKFDLIEFCVKNIDVMSPNMHKMYFVDALNAVLKIEMSAFRIVGDQLTQLTSEQEIAAIETAENLDGKFGPVSEHIRAAVRMLSDRNSPDYRNSIKESISAVESICRLATGRDTLAGALAVLPRKGITVHGAIQDAFKKLYGYTSDADGIRHALLDWDALDHEDAKFMLVTCSAFINLVQARQAERAGTTR